jgi:hypothetical protein
MLPHEADALAAQRAIYGRPIAYTGAGLDGSDIVAIRSDTRGQSSQGMDGRAPSLTFEIVKSDLPEEPDKDNLIVEADGAHWSVVDIGDRPDIEVWELSVEEAPAAEAAAA